MVLLSASVKRFGVSCMQDFFYNLMFFHTFARTSVFPQKTLISYFLKVITQTRAKTALTMAYSENGMSVKKVARKLSKKCHKVARTLLESCQKVDRKLPNNWHKIARKLPESCQNLATKLLESCQKCCKPSCLALLSPKTNFLLI